MPRREAPRQPTLIFRNVILGGVFWTKFEHFLTKIRIPNFKIQLLGRAKRKGVGGKESRVAARDKLLPALAFRFHFFSAAAEFRASETGTPPFISVYQNSISKLHFRHSQTKRCFRQYIHCLFHRQAFHLQK